MKTLIVEPSKAYRQMLGVLYRAVGFETSVVSSAEEALQILSGAPVDLLCTSWQLPDTDGIELCKKIRALDGMEQIPVLLMTSEEDKKVLANALRAGVTEIFLKSDISTLELYLCDFINRSKTQINLQGHILYVEDSHAIAKLTTYILEEIGFSVDHFIGAEEAYQSFQEIDYDLVLTDVVLEGTMSGIGLVRAVRSSKDNRRLIPILAISALDDSARKIELLNSGVNDYIAKPILEQELVARVRNLICNKQLMDKIRSQQKHLQQQALTDQLTSLYNRHYLMDFASNRISEACRHKYPISLVVVDLDHFKSINDTHGHAVGDLVLVQIARVLKSNCRKEDLAARFGGEEFVLILTHCNSSDAFNKIELLREQIAEMNPEGIAVTASFGIAELPLDEPCTFETLFSAADCAVYKAKDNGRNCVVVGEVVKSA